jgi:hypothetical protein
MRVQDAVPTKCMRIHVYMTDKYSKIIAVFVCIYVCANALFDEEKATIDAIYVTVNV